ncbi:hypothetical protein [Jeotgalicoccus sp. S0W5]|uniref:hypothetical protein n=1 Tax=Jeotgalicoccus sp. S0W5 TaxID=2527874 RepID=UPI001414F84A|nr:hypothetical protein [Jeotgalicoccus sp. S0W5]
MKKTFDICLMNDDCTYVTQTINGAKNIIVTERIELTLNELENIINQAEKIAKGKYGFDVYYRRADKLHKLHTRDNSLAYCNDTVKANENALSHARKIYNPASKAEQITMF